MELTVTTGTILPTMLQMRNQVINGLTSPHSKRAYTSGIDSLYEFAAGQPMTRDLVLRWKSSMVDAGLSAQTVNLRLAAARALVNEARRSDLLGVDEASNITEIPNVKQNGTRTGNWLTQDQVKALLTTCDNSVVGIRDRCMISILIGCALRRSELAGLQVSDLQQRDGRWVICDLKGKGGRLRTIAIPSWTMHSIREWMMIGEIVEGSLFKSVCDLTVWRVVVKHAAQIGIPDLAAHDLRRTSAKLCKSAGGDIQQIQFMLGHSSVQTTERYLGSDQNLTDAVNDKLNF